MFEVIENSNMHQPKYSIRAILVITKILGGFPLSENWKENRKNVFGKIYVLFILFMYTIIFFTSFSNKHNGPEIYYFTNTILSFIFYINLVTLLVTTLRNKKRLIEILHKFITFDKLIGEKLNIKINYKSSSFFTCGIIFIITFILAQAGLCDFAILVISLKNISPQKWLAIFIPLIISTYYQTLIVVLGYLLLQRFKTINKKLFELCYTKSLTQMLVLNKKIDTHVQILRILKFVNNDLKNIANKICQCFSFPILTSSGTALFVITVQLYYLIMMVRASNNVSDDTQQADKSKDEAEKQTKIIWQIGVCLVNVIILHIVQLVLVVSIFSFVKNQVRISTNYF